MKTRVISGIFLIAISLVVFIVGGPLVGLVAMLLSLCGVFEMCRVYKIEKHTPAVVAYIWTVLYYITLIFGDFTIDGFPLLRLTLPIMITFLLAILVVYVFKFPKYHDREIMAAFMSFFYVSVMLSYLYKLRVVTNGFYYIVLVYICSWGADTLAYFTGVLFGKHKMSPKLSPKKSVEGLIGGIVGSGLLGLLYAFLFQDKFDVKFNIYVTMFIVCSLGAIPSVIGDLAASAIKRNNDVKDYGKLIPGHGGVLDRFDSMIFTAPVLYYLILFMVNN